MRQHRPNPNHNLPRPRLLLWSSSVLIAAASSCQNPPPPTWHQPPAARVDIVHCPWPIAFRGRAQTRELIAFFKETNPQIDPHNLNLIVQAYMYEAAAEGINHDIAFCQMVHETDYLRFGGDVDPSQNNFCGLGATGGGEPGLTFPSIRIGIRAHIQHLKAYANAEPLRNLCVDPRFEKVRRGDAPCVDDLTGKWATDPLYAFKVKQKLQKLEQHLYEYP